jgi:hypothetical protein
MSYQPIISARSPGRQTRQMLLALLSSLLIVTLMSFSIILLSDQLLTIDSFRHAFERHLSQLTDITEQRQIEHKPPAILDIKFYKFAPGEKIVVSVISKESIGQYIEKFIDAVNNPLVDYSGPPHMFVKGRLVVNYNVMNSHILLTLQHLLGDEIKTKKD